MATDYKKQIESFKNIEKTLKKKVGSTPTEANIRRQQELESLKSKRTGVEKKMMAEKWYGDRDIDKGESGDGLLSRGLHLLGMPLYATVGAAESVLGEGTESGLFQNIISNIEEKEAFGDLLRKKGVANAASIPLGFAMDMAFDPLIWGTMGTSALVPKVVKGAKKAGIEGAKLGAKSHLLKRAAQTTKFIPGLKNTAQKLGKKAVGLDELYKIKTGTAIEDILIKKATKGPLPFIKGRPGEIVENALKKKLGEEKGQKIIDFFGYKPVDAFQKSIEDDIKIGEQIAKGERFTGDKEQMLRQFGTRFNLVDELEEAGKMAKDMNPREYGQYVIRKQLDDSLEMATKKSVYGKEYSRAGVRREMIYEGVQDEKSKIQIQKIMKDVEDEVKKAYGDKYKIGVGFFDEMQESFRKIKVKDKEVGKIIADSYDVYINLFKTSKVPLNPAAYANAVVGNLSMGWMGGLPMGKKIYRKNIFESTKFINGLLSPEKQIAYAKQFAKNDDWLKVMNEYPTTFRSIMSAGPEDLIDKPRKIVNEIMDNFNKLPLSQKEVHPLFKELSSFKGSLKNLSDDITELEKSVQQAKGLIKNQLSKKPKGITERILERTTKEAKKIGIANADDIVKTQKSTFMAEELYSGPGFETMVKNVKKIADKGGKGSKAAKAFYWYLTKPMDAYSSVDAGYKLGTALTISNHGVNQRSLETLANFINIGPDDIIHGAQEFGEQLYKIKPLKAMEIVSEMYMNYSAMPGFVKVMRKIPLVGSPFVSFAYGMGTKAGKTAMYNPQFYNKMQWFLKELQGEKSPLEQKALEGKYYNWLNREGIVKLPFFQENPIYANLANMIPYYTMNMLQPTERTYKDTLSGTVMNAIDKTPFFKTPEGQVFLDYIVQPLILKESNPVGMFDQQLFPTNASDMEKVGYAARAFAEAPIPSAAGLAGLGTGIIAPGATEYIPSFRWRQLANAVQGKTSVGVPSSENATQRTLRTLLSTFGLPVYPVNTKYSSKDKK